MTPQIQSISCPAPEADPAALSADSGCEVSPQLLHLAANQMITIVRLMNGSLHHIETSHPEVRCYQYWLDVCNDSARLQQILRGLIGYETGGRPSLKRTDLQKLLRGAYLSCLPLTEGTGKSLTFTSTTNGPCLYLDAEDIRTAVINLIQNALEAVGSDGTVQLRLSADRTRAIIQVQDNGCGITPEHLLTIFQPFVSYRTDGIGLGLTIARRIFDTHHGSISVSSCPGQGTTVTVTLPRTVSGSPASFAAASASP